MNNPTDLLRAAVPAALEAGKAVIEIYAHPDAEWEVEKKADNSPLTLADRTSHAIILRHLAATGCPVLSEEGAHLPFAERRAWKQLWVVDPLDGTKEFLKRNGEFTVNIAFVEDGVPVAGVIYVPATFTLYFGVTGFGAFKVGDVTAFHNEVELIRGAQRLPVERAADADYVVVASRSHLSPETEEFIDHLRRRHPALRCISAGSSLKLCRVAEGSAQFYPRFAPTMEWDTAAGDAIVRASGGEVLDAADSLPLRYNKEDLHNPWFVALHRD